jgi:hypothetical protein
MHSHDSRDNGKTHLGSKCLRMHSLQNTWPQARECGLMKKSEHMEHRSDDSSADIFRPSTVDSPHSLHQHQYNANQCYHTHHYISSSLSFTHSHTHHSPSTSLSAAWRDHIATKLYQYQKIHNALHNERMNEWMNEWISKVIIKRISLRLFRQIPLDFQIFKILK